MGGRYIIQVSLNAPSAPAATLIMDSKELNLGKLP